VLWHDPTWTVGRHVNGMVANKPHAAASGGAPPGGGGGGGGGGGARGGGGGGGGPGGGGPRCTPRDVNGEFPTGD
jgi:hypothetical protein